MSILKKKEQIAYLLASFLDRQRHYTEIEIDAFIGTSIKFDVQEDPRLTADHLRRAMIELGYLQRTPDGRQYWVKETFIQFSEQEAARLQQINAVVEKAANGKAECPFCGELFSAQVLGRHYSKRHRLEKTWDSLVEQFFV